MDLPWCDCFMSFQEKIQALSQAGTDKLHIICDFDRTLTDFRKGG
ncbi:MAG: hypothetical protein ACI9QC_000056, partial [Oceanicoccus sp.]